MNGITNGEIESGSDVCPSCKSDSWKSAKMVVMEGTTNIKGTLDGTVTDPGKLSGGVRNFLLSDRWFSWDYPLESQIGLTSSTGLVEEVKRFMVAHDSKLNLPAAPVPPPPPEGLNYSPSFLVMLGPFAIFLMVLIGLFWYLAITLENSSLMLIAIIVTVGFAFYLSEKPAALIDKSWKVEDKHSKSQNDAFQKAMTVYNKQLAEYEMEANDPKIKQIERRELLWDRARVCMRCGTAYLGSG